MADEDNTVLGNDLCASRKIEMRDALDVSGYTSILIWAGKRIYYFIVVHIDGSFFKDFDQEPILFLSGTDAS